MGLRGPAPAPIAIQKARGSWRYKHTDEVGIEERVRPEMPSELQGDEVSVWDHLSEKLDRMEVLHEIDGLELSRYCELYIQWRKVMAVIKSRKSMTYPIKDRKGEIIGMKTYPEMKIAQNLNDQLNRLASKFGLTPSDRVRLSAVLQAENGEKGGSKGGKSRDNRRDFFEK